jgi:uncharacterized protein YfaS (alpha-2-macroglobulin family)
LYRVVVTGTAPRGAHDLLVTDLLPGGFEIERAPDASGDGDAGTDHAPDRTEARDDRVLFFRTKPIDGRFTVAYLVRAVTAGRFAVPAVRAELLYDPGVQAAGEDGAFVEIE